MDKEIVSKFVTSLVLQQINDHINANRNKLKAIKNEPIESKRMAESVVEGNAGDHDGFNLPRFAMSLVQFRSHQLDFPERFMLIVDAER